MAAISVVIGDERSTRKGTGEETARALIDWLFGPRGLDKVFARVLASNSICTAWIGSRLSLEGRLRRHVLPPDGNREDILLYGLLKEDWPRLRAGSVARTIAKRDDDVVPD